MRIFDLNIYRLPRNGDLKYDMQKQITALILITAMLFAFCGCGSESNNSSAYHKSSAPVSAFSDSVSEYSSQESSDNTDSDNSLKVSSEESQPVCKTETNSKGVGKSTAEKNTGSGSADIAISKNNASKSQTTSSKTVSVKTQQIKTSTEMRAVWFSYIDLNFSQTDTDGFKAKINEMFDNVKTLGMNTVICQVRANSDAAYNSKYFPRSAAYTNIDIDPLEYMTSAAHDRGLRIEAWINPYRVTAAHKNVNKLPDGCPAKIWLTDSDKTNDNDVLTDGKGFYYNPASKNVQKLIINGVKEILENYKVDGIQFDDYFYPTEKKTFDEVSYNQYAKSCKTAPLSLEEWRRTNVNVMVSKVYKTVHGFKGKVFGISPAAHISSDGSDDNFKKLYADYYSWCGGGYIDYIAPQLYFGYKYPLDNYKFLKLLNDWCALERSNGVKLYIGLAPYKIDTADAGSKEWKTDERIIARQIADVRKQSAASGFMLYSYTYLTDISKKHTSEVSAIVKAVR